MRTSFAGISALVLLSACVEKAAPPEQRPQAPAPAVNALPATAVGEDWRDVALTPGTWTYRSEGSAGSIAQFGPAGGTALLAMRCDATKRRIAISRGALTATPATLGFVTSSGNFRYPAMPAAGEPPSVAASVPALDPNFDKLAFSRGRFLVTLAGRPRLVVPAWSEVARVIEDCRG